MTRLRWLFSRVSSGAMAILLAGALSAAPASAISTGPYARASYNGYTNLRLER